MNRSYLRYVPTETWGVIASGQCNDVLLDAGGKLAITACLGDVCAFNIRQSAKIRTMRPPGPTLEDPTADVLHHGEVTSLALSPDGKVVAAGYSSGVINVFDLNSGLLRVTLHGHKSAVVCLEYSKSGTVLASGGADTDIILWDLITESGMFRLRGHKDAVNAVRLIENESGQPTHLISVSKDALAKIWELSTQHSIQTLTGHRSEVWALDLSPDQKRMVTGAADKQLRVWSLEKATGSAGLQGEEAVATYMGAVLREGNDRCLNVRFSEDGKVLLAQDAGKIVDVYRVRDADEAKKKMKRRLKRAREKSHKRGKDKKGESESVGAWGLTGANADGEEVDHHDEHGEKEESLAASDEVEFVVSVRASHKVRAMAISRDRSGGVLRVLLALRNNSLELYNVTLTSKEYIKSTTIDSLGHRSDVRALTMSSDNEMLASTDSAQLKVWNRKGQCLRTAPVGFGLCVTFLPGDRHLVIGTKEGKLHLVDLASGEPIESHDAHTGALWSLDLKPDGKGLVTGSADHDVKFWDLELVDGKLSLVHTRTLKMADDVLAVRYSRTKDPEKLLVAVALLDSTVKVFYENSLRFFLSLYGHKLPVMALDISDDNEIIATASADKTVKIWGLDFGDCHRSLLAHHDSVMGLRFIPGSHCFFSCSKDRTIKYWDADHFEHILTMPGHQAEVWALAMASDGSSFASCGHDRSLRLWERSDDQVYIEEERERELDAMFDSELEKPRAPTTIAAGAEAGEGEEGTAEESALASRRSLEAVKSAERLGNALELAAADEEFLKADPDRAPNPLMLGLSPARYILFNLRLIKGPDLEQALLVLTLDASQRLMRYLAQLMEEGVEVELCWRVAVFLLRIHHGQLLSCRALLPVLTRIRGALRERLRMYRDGLAMNAAGLRLLKRELEQDRMGIMTDDGDSGDTKKPRS